MNRFLLIIVFSVLLSFSGTVTSEELISEFRGSRSTETLQFEVGAPWVLDWRINTDYPGQMGIDITLVKAGTGSYEGAVLKTKWPGNGVRLFDEGGKYQFKVVSHLSRWILKVKTLSPEEAELYTPKTRD